mgnify:CR=1 FL=1
MELHLLPPPQKKEWTFSVGGFQPYATRFYIYDCDVNGYKAAESKSGVYRLSGTYPNTSNPAGYPDQSLYPAEYPAVLSLGD